MVDTVSIFGGGNGIILAADLDFPSTISAAGIVIVTGIDTTSALTEVLGLAGKYVVPYIELAALTSESVQITLDVDGEEKWNTTFTLPASTLILSGARNPSAVFAVADLPLRCNSTFSLKVQMSADNSISINYLARKVK